jgi:hypothetical protein
MALVVNYQKRKNAELFKSLEGSLLLSKIQNYIPIYNRFFSLNDTNYNSINLNHKSHISNVRKINDKFKCCIKSIERGKEKEKEKEKENVDIFFKMAPLLDPFKYLIGKYDTNDPNLLTLPDNTSTETSVNPKYVDVNNSAYVDGLFLYVTNFLLHEHGFINGVDYYGSFLAIKNDFKLNIFDDIDFLNESSFFKKNRNILYKVDDFDNLFDIDNNSVALKPIKIQHNTSAGSCISLKSLNGELFENMFDDNNMAASETTASETTASFDAMTVVELNDISCMNDIQITTLRSNSSCSSTSSHTNDGDDDTEDNTEENNKEDSDTEWSDESSYTEEVIEATIPKFPVQVICMENCENTFDDLILNNELSNDEWFSALMQIIMILITYQKTFSFTHNDLHTNNVMYNQTDRKFIYYLYGKKYYKVPTFGRIFKVIDFGRSIYKVNGKVFCSDSFKIGGDAATQYNTEPFFNDKKARLDPNFSFDLCRLACSIYDYVIDDAKQIKNPVHKVIYDWCLDDSGCNLLYKNNGVERYPEFKLYKMIARCVHNHTPQLQLDRPEFKTYEFTGKVKGDIVDIDKMPVCV